MAAVILLLIGSLVSIEAGLELEDPIELRHRNTGKRVPNSLTTDVACYGVIFDHAMDAKNVPLGNRYIESDAAVIVGRDGYPISASFNCTQYDPPEALTEMNAVLSLGTYTLTCPPDKWMLQVPSPSLGDPKVIRQKAECVTTYRQKPYSVRAGDSQCLEVDFSLPPDFDYGAAFILARGYRAGTTDVPAMSVQVAAYITIVNIDTGERPWVIPGVYQRIYRPIERNTSYNACIGAIQDTEFIVGIYTSPYGFYWG